MLNTVLSLSATLAFVLGPLVVHAMWCAVLVDGSPFRRDFWTCDPEATVEPLDWNARWNEARSWAAEDFTSLRNRVRNPDVPRRNHGTGQWLDSWTFR